MSSPPEQPGTTRRLAVVGTDLKFIRPLLTRFEATGRFRVRVDEWPKFRAHDPESTEEILAWADIVVCEWAGPNAVLASRAKRPNQRLVVRLHRMELSHPEWREIDISAVDLVVAVGPYYRRRIIEVTGWPESKVTVIPNFVDEEALALPKTDDARFHLGMIGYASSRKRLDLALDLLTEVRRREPRYRLRLKGDQPWGLKWVEDRPAEVDFFGRIRRRLDDDADLAGAVSFDPPGSDIGPWLQQIGFIVSTSDDESFHLSPAEGMASGAVPVIRPWPGADEIYEREWVVDGSADQAERIVSLGATEQTWAAAGERARHQVLARYRLGDVTDLWLERALGDPGSG